MKFADTFAKHLREHFSEVYVYDQRGDGHFLQMIAIDDVFKGNSLVQRSRMIFVALGEMKKKVHAYSVKGFTPDEWERQKDNFELIEYVHIK